MIGRLTLPGGDPQQSFAPDAGAGCSGAEAGNGQRGI
jgi:hypothetical protein